MIETSINNETNLSQMINENVSTKKGTSIEVNKEPVKNEFNVHCPGCNVKLKVDIKNEKLSLIK